MFRRTGSLSRADELVDVHDCFSLGWLLLVTQSKTPLAGERNQSPQGAGEPPPRGNVSVFGKAGEAAAEYLGKGWLIAVDGRVEFGQWETEGGEKRHDYRVVWNLEFLTARRPVEPEAEAKPARRKREPVAA
jgi:single-stranded DNA-binding protein